MLILCIHYNQLCNRIFAYLPALAYAIEHDQRVMFLFQNRKYDALFPNLHSQKISSHLTIKKLYPGFCLKMCINLVKTIFWKKQGKSTDLPIKGKGNLLFSPGWKGRDSYPELVEKHSDKLRELFAPQPDIQQQISRQIVEPNKDYTLIGIHIRRGDYQHCAPKYFFDWKDYLGVMQRMSQLLPGQKLKFVICSNEKVPEDIFKGFDCFVWDNSSITLDIYSLAACRYIIGAPSTFSQWASFYSQQPLYVMRSKNQEFSLSDFVTVKKLLAI